jgi:hypothetical protein
MGSEQLRGMKLPPPRFRLAPLTEELRQVRGFHDLQTFFPTLSKLYRLSKKESEGVWLDSKLRIQALDISGTSGPCSVLLVPNEESVSDAAAGECVKQRAFLKVTHLLDPIRWMRGNYSLPRHSGLPWHSKTWSAAWTKLQDPWNQAYVETLATYALGRLREEGASPHFNTFFGAFCAKADIYRYNLTDDFPSMRNERWFWTGQKSGLYALRAMQVGGTSQEDDEFLKELLTEPEELDSSSEENSDSEKGSDLEEDKSIEEEEIQIEEAAAAEVLATALESGDLVSLHSEDMSSVSEEEGSISDEEAPVRLERMPGHSSRTPSATSSTEDDSEDSDDSEYPEYRIYAELRDFPVMLIAGEENQGTMDQLLENTAAVGAEPGQLAWETRWSAWLFQVVAALSCAQAVLGFTHNDLHTNNIVWIDTTEEYLTYTNRAGAVFRVPTFGKLFRIIDFGRAIFWINDTQFISDDFRAGNDADGQYNFKPLQQHPVGPLVYPNPSFDLCRLAVSLFEAIFPEAPAEKEDGAMLSTEEGLEMRETISPLHDLLWTWMLDDDGRNVLIEPDGEERFPDFDLYKHIAAKVHRAVPSQQFGHPAFDQFAVAADQVPEGTKKWSLFC